MFKHEKLFKQKNIVESEKAITLIALVVTIVVLLILAGVSIAMLAGDNGIINQAQIAKEETEKAQNEELVKLEALGSFDENGNFDSEKFKNNIEKNLEEYNPKISEDEDKITVTIDDTQVEIDKGTGNVYSKTRVRPIIETTVYQINGQAVEVGVNYDNVIITVNVSNKNKFENIEIELKNSDGTKINPESQVTGNGTISYMVHGEGTYIVTVKGTIEGVTNTQTATVEIKSAKEEIPPTVTFGTNGSTTYSKTQSTVVTITDEGGSGVDNNSLKYQWTQSTQEPSENTFKDPFTSGQTITKNDVTGNNWYLWVLAKDKEGNTTITRSNAFYFDNTPPTNTAPMAEETIDNNIVVTLKQTDNESGINRNTIQYAIKKSTDSSWGEWITDSNNSHTFTNLDLATTYEVKTRVQDILGNGYTESDVTRIECGYNVNVKYTVEHYQENLEGNGYNLVDKEEKAGKINTEVTGIAKEYEGFKYDDKIEGTQSTGIATADGALVLKLYYKRNTYTLELTYDNTIISGVTGEGQYKYGQNVTINASLKQVEGYTTTWKNWTTSDGQEYNTTQNYNFTMPAKDLALVANGTKTANTYTIIYNENGATEGTTSNSVHTYDVEQSLTANGYIKTGYVFKGWNTNSEGTGTSYTDGEKIKNLTKENGTTITLYAQWVEAVASIENKNYETLQEAVDAVPTNNQETTVNLLKDTSEDILVEEGKNIIFEFNNKLLRNKEYAIIKNEGNITIKNANMQIDYVPDELLDTGEDGTQKEYISAIINYGQTTILSGNIISMTQARIIENLNGKVTILDGAYLEGNGTNVVAINNRAEMEITGGELLDKQGQLISNRGGNMIIS